MLETAPATNRVQYAARVVVFVTVESCAPQGAPIVSSAVDSAMARSAGPV
jgi:hypothetical protein